MRLVSLAALEAKKKENKAAIMIKNVDRIIARRYIKTFREIGELHDQLVGQKLLPRSKTEK